MEDDSPPRTTYPSREEDARGERPPQQELEDDRHRVHVYARKQDHEDREEDRVKASRGLVVAELEKARHGVDAAGVIEGDHEQRHEDHRRDRPDPVVVGLHDAVLGGACSHAHDLQCPQVGPQESEARHSRRQGPSRQEVVLRGLHPVSQDRPDLKHEPSCSTKYTAMMK
jgi:hypothetical protein